MTSLCPGLPRTKVRVELCALESVQRHDRPEARRKLHLDSIHFHHQPYLLLRLYGDDIIHVSGFVNSLLQTDARSEMNRIDKSFNLTRIHSLSQHKCRHKGGLG